MNAIETHSLTKRYGRARGIEELELSVAQGEFFGFIGPNGAGKSTTIRTLLGLISPTSGTGTVLGRDIRGPKPQLLADVGYLSADANLYPTLRVGEVLELSARLRGKDCRAEAKRLCDRLELDPRRKLYQLSLGNRKKAAIVCALQHQPRLCILDEPTSGLDPLVQHEFYAILEERNRAGAAIFLSSHVLSEVQRYCKRAAVIRDGRLLVCAPMEELARADAKRVALRGVSAPPEGLPGIRDVTSADGSVSFLYSGPVNALVAALAPLPIADLSITEPDLDEIFLHYYEKEGQK